MTDPISDEELAAMEAMANAATEGPWKWVSNFAGDGWRVSLVAVSRNDSTLEMYPVLEVRLTGLVDAIKDVEGSIVAEEPADLDFIASVRSDVPRLIAEVRRLKKLCGEGSDK